MSAETATSAVTLGLQSLYLIHLENTGQRIPHGSK